MHAPSRFRARHCSAPVADVVGRSSARCSAIELLHPGRGGHRLGERERHERASVRRSPACRAAQPCFEALRCLRDVAHQVRGAAAGPLDQRQIGRRGSTFCHAMLAARRRCAAAAQPDHAQALTSAPTASAEPRRTLGGAR